MADFFTQLSQVRTETWITLLILFVIAVAVIYILSIWIYKRAPANMGFIRTGLFGTKVCLGRGALVLPVFHEVTWVSLETIKLTVSRSREQAFLTQDNIRVDMVAELFAHVGHTKAEMLQASRSLGEKTFDPEQVRNLLEAKVVSALRSYSATKTLRELHENRETLSASIKESVSESFGVNGLVLEEVTIVTLEQAAKEHFRRDNVFDAEGLKIITEITSNARRAVHNTEKRTSVAIRQRDLDTQLEMLEIERQEAFARASQDKEVSNEQALKLQEKQVYILDQRLQVDTKEISNEQELEKLRTKRDLYFTEEARRREIAEVQKTLALELEEKTRQIELIAKAREEELVNIARNLALEKSEKDRQIELTGKTKEEELATIARSLARESAEKDREVKLIAKEQGRQTAEIDRITTVASHEEKGRQERHEVAEGTSLAMRKKSLETRLGTLEVEKEDAFAAAHQEREVADEQARVLSEQQRFLLEQRWQVEQEEIKKAQALEQARISKDIVITGDLKKREAAEIQRNLSRESEERDREIALVAKDSQLEQERVRENLAVELEERSRDISLIAKDQERERTDIQRFLARELEEQDRQIATTDKARELEQTEIKRLQITAQKIQAEHDAESVRLIADTKRGGEVERLQAKTQADTREIDEVNKAQISKMHMLTQSESRRDASKQEAEATLVRANANSEAQQIAAVGIEREAGAVGRAEMEIDTLRATNRRHMLEAEAQGIEAKADALKTYNESAAFLELAQLHISAERDIHIDQAKAMGNALSQAQIRMYGGDGGTVDTIRSLFTSGFGMGEVLEGIAQSLPAGLRERFSANGLRGIFGQPYASTDWRRGLAQLGEFVQQNLATRKSRDIPFSEGVAMLEEKAGNDESLGEALTLVKEVNQHGMFDDVPFEKVWALVKQAVSEKDGGEKA